MVEWEECPFQCQLPGTPSSVGIPRAWVRRVGVDDCVVPAEVGPGADRLQRTDRGSARGRLCLGIERVDTVAEHIGDDLEPEWRAKHGCPIRVNRMIGCDDGNQIVVDRGEPVGRRFKRCPENLGRCRRQFEPGDRSCRGIVPTRRTFTGEEWQDGEPVAVGEHVDRIRHQATEIAARELVRDPAGDVAAIAEGSAEDAVVAIETIDPELARGSPLGNEGRFRDDGPHRAGRADREGDPVCPDTTRADVRGRAIANSSKPRDVRQRGPALRVRPQERRQWFVAIDDRWHLVGANLHGIEDRIEPVNTIQPQQPGARGHRNRRDGLASEMYGHEIGQRHPSRGSGERSGIFVTKPAQFRGPIARMNATTGRGNGFGDGELGCQGRDETTRTLVGPHEDRRCRFAVCIQSQQPMPEAGHPDRSNGLAALPELRDRPIQTGKRQVNELAGVGFGSAKAIGAQRVGDLRFRSRDLMTARIVGKTPYRRRSDVDRECKWGTSLSERFDGHRGPFHRTIAGHPVGTSRTSNAAITNRMLRSFSSGSRWRAFGNGEMERGRDVSLAQAGKTVTMLAGGVGGAKLAEGFARILPDPRLQVIVNTADDFRLYGLAISPDIDTVTYTLAGIANPAQSWGIVDDTRHTLDAIARLGGEAWFLLGDQDFATHILRTERLDEGLPLSRVTADFASALGIGPRIIPMSDQLVATLVDTPEGRLGFQEYFVARRQADDVVGVFFDGIEDALPAPGVIDALVDADVIVIAPSNPIVSVGPILAVEGVRQALASAGGLRIAVSPIIGGKALKGPADKMLATLGHEVSSVGVARIYAGLIDVLAIDDVDADQATAIEALGIRTLVTNTVMGGSADRERLAAELLAVVSSGVRS